MGLAFHGYFLDSCRVGSSNSPFTITPTNYISNLSAYETAYPLSEVNPRTEYLTLVLVDGDLPEAQFGWTKNEILNRFSYDGRDQQFRPLRGAPIIQVGVLASDANTNRLKVAKPVQVMPEAPFRLSVGTSGSGQTFTIVLVANDGAFSTPSAGSVQLSQTTGNLNWNPSDITGFIGQQVRYQRQTFYGYTDSNGNIGPINSTLLLNPIPGLGISPAYQFPLIKIGYGRWLQTHDVADDAALASYSPAQGEVAWSRATGLLKFNSTDVASSQGASVYYDGVLFGKDLSLPRQNVGFVGGYPSGPMTGVPLVGGDLIFRAENAVVGTSTCTFPDNLTLQDLSADFFGAGVEAGDVIVIQSGRMAGDRFPIVDVEINTLSVDRSTPFTFLAGATYEVLQQNQFLTTTLLDAIDPTDEGSYGEVQVEIPTGNLKYSLFDQLEFVGYAVECVFCDLPIERGVSLRLFRTPVDPGAQDSALKDVSATYPVVEAIWASPITGSPQVILPITPLDDGSMTVHVEQGTGFFESDDLPRLDLSTVPVSVDPIYGYTINFDTRTFSYAVRLTNRLIPIQAATGSVALDPLTLPNNLVLELETGTMTNVYTPLTLGQDILFDANSGVVSFITTKGVIQDSSSTGVLAFGTNFSDLAGGFTSGPNPINPGDSLIIDSGPAKGVYGISAVVSNTHLTLNESGPSDTNINYKIRRGNEILADRFFGQVLLVDPRTKVERIHLLGAVQDSPRYSINPAYADPTLMRFRFGQSTFSSGVTVVSTDGSFTAPSSLSSGQVEISQTTGNLNFSQDDVDSGVSVYAVRLLAQKVDYTVQPLLGTIFLTDRMLKNDELLVSYISAPKNAPIVRVNNERGTFRVGKEVTQPHPAPTSVLSFNPHGHSVALNPPPKVYRGGRPQRTVAATAATVGPGTPQITINTVNSTITFLADSLRDNTTHHGAIIAPSERIYIDYFVYQAMGGEKTITVLQLPMKLESLTITEDESSFTVQSDHTQDFPANRLLRIEGQEVYLIGSSSYDSGSDTTTVTLASPQVFQTSYNDPKVFVTSGPTRASGTMFLPSYFTPEINTFDTVPRGSNTISIQGDKSSVYVAGTVVMFTGGSPAVLDLYLVTGSSYKKALDRTVVTITFNTSTEYTGGIYNLSRSFRPILENNSAPVQTRNVPVDADEVLVYRQIEGSAGQLQQETTDYTIDASGQIRFNIPLQPNEEFAAFYTGYQIIQAGPRFRASYTTGIIPNDVNGLLNQILTADYATFSPDSFFYRVETATNFKAEVTAKLQSSSTSAAPTGGPRTSNTAQLSLFQQGTASVFYDERYFENEDFIARKILKFYNDVINFLEDALGNMDGRIVGDTDGRFLFDGNIDNHPIPIPPFAQYPPGPVPLPPINLARSTNQIDDQILISPFPIADTDPLIPLTFIGTYAPVFESFRLSRFYPTARTIAGVTVGGSDTGAQPGDPIFDLKATNVTSVFGAVRRRPRARVLRKAYAGDTTLYVTGPNDINIDNIHDFGMNLILYRPFFPVGLAVDITDRDGTPLVVNPLPLNPSIGSPTQPTWTIASVLDTPDRLVLSAPLPVDIPIGATIAQPYDEPLYGPPYSASNGNFPFGHLFRLDIEYYADTDNGQLLYSVDLSGGGTQFSPPIVMPTVNERWFVQYTVNPNGTPPRRVPALDGIPLNDNGDETLPLIQPSPYCEAPNLVIEKDYETRVLVSPVVTPPLVATGTLNALLTTITLTTGTFASPVPQSYDLVRILNGLNGTTQYRRVVSATTNSVTVDVPFSTLDTGFQFLVTVSASIASGVTGITSGTSLTDTFATFTSSGILPGYTVVVTSGPSIGDRRQILKINSNTVLTVDHAFSVSGIGNTYRIVNSLNTYSDGDSTPLAALANAILASKNAMSTYTSPSPPATLPFNNEVLAIESVLNLVFTDLVSPATQTGTVSGNTLTGTTNFVAAGVAKGDFIYIRSGVNAGIYQVKDPPHITTHTLSVRGSFASAGTVSYRVVSSFGITQTKSLQDLLAVLVGPDSSGTHGLNGGFAGVDSLITSGDSFLAEVLSTIGVLVPPATVDPNIYANALSVSDISARASQVNTRLSAFTAPTGPIGNIQNFMRSGEKLYDNRYTWIKARIDLQSGTLPQLQRAVSVREQKLSDLIETLEMILAVENS